MGLTWRLIILAVVVAAIALTLAQSLRVYFAQAADITALRVEIENRRNEIAELEDQLARWDDPAFVKAEARERLGWVMPGEIGYRVIGLDGKPVGGDSAVLAPEAEPTAKGLWWERVWGSVAVADQPVPEPSVEATPTAPATTIGPPPSPSATKSN